MSAERSVQHPPQLQAGKQAFSALVAAVGGQLPAEKYSGRAQSRISAYGGPNTDSFAPIDVVVKLEGVTHGTPGHPHVTRWLAREAGYALVQLPAPDAPSTVWSQHGATLLKEVGDIASGLGAALAGDNDLDKREAKRLLADADEMVDAAVAFRAALKARAEVE